MKKTSFPWWKLVLGFLLYLLFHQAYSLTSGSLLGTILGEAIQAIYPHMKMLFYAYAVVSGVDYFIQRKKGTLGSAFFYSRMLILASAPWMMIAIYFSPEALGITFPHVMEIIWGILMTLVGLYLCIRLEEPFDHLPLRPAAKAMIALAFLGAIITYVGFSFHVPDNFFIVIK